MESVGSALAMAAQQCGAGLSYYLGLVVMMRLAGKRYAGQTTTFDLLVLISLSVALQTVTLRPGPANAAVFILTIFGAHRSLGGLCVRYPRLKALVRGKPRALIRDGRVMERALEREGLSREDLDAGLRKQGLASVDCIKLAVLEETGHITVVVEGGGTPPG